MKIMYKIYIKKKKSCKCRKENYNNLKRKL